MPTMFEDVVYTFIPYGPITRTALKQSLFPLYMVIEGLCVPQNITQPPSLGTSAIPVIDGILASSVDSFYNPVIVTALMDPPAGKSGRTAVLHAADTGTG